MPFKYPVALEVEGRRCIVIGGGTVGEQKARALIDAGAGVSVLAETFTGGLEDLEREGKLELIRKPYSYGDLEGAFLAIAATDDPKTNAEIYREANEKKVLLNAVDDDEHCHFSVPSIVRRGDLVIAISTGGKAPALSKRLRRKLTAQFGPEYETLIDLLGEIREEAIRKREVDFATWATRWEQALEHDLLALIREGKLDEAKELVRRTLTEGAPAKGSVAIVGAGPGDPGLLTLRGRQLLDDTDVIVYDRLVHPSLIEGKEAIYAGKQPGHEGIVQEEINTLLVTLAKEGKRVVRLKGGDPFVFGRGAEEAEALADAGIDFEIVPASTSAIAALAYAGIPITDRRYSSSVAIVTGHCTDQAVDWKKIATAVDTVVILMGLSNLDEIVGGLLSGGMPPDTPAAIVSNGTLPTQQVITADLATLPSDAKAAGLSGPAIIVAGKVVSLRKKITWFENEEGAIL